MRTNYSKSRISVWCLSLATLVLPSVTQASIILVQTSDPGYYNDSLGTTLNGTNGGDTSTGYFPINDDSTVVFPNAPDLSAASAALGNWLTNPLSLNANWSYEPAIPNNWVVETEVAVMYQFNTLGATNVVANFGVDNGIFVWLDGVYLGGERRPGSFALGEHVYNVGNLAAGTHFLQLLLEDHGGSNGYAVQITADEFIPAVSTPEPATMALLGLTGLGGIGLRMRKRRKSNDVQAAA